MILVKNCYFSRSIFSQERAAQSSDKVLPVPVGDSSRAFSDLFKASITFDMYSVY